MAAANGHMSIVEYLISQGVVRIIITPMVFEIWSFSLKKKRYIEDLVFFFFFGEQDINALNEENNAPLHWACLNGHIEVTNLPSLTLKEVLLPV